jgi:hypothetical protein
MSILIYQMGKVGSITILKTLIQLGYRPYHAHRIWADGEFGLGHTLKQKQHILNQKSIKAITLVREPIARNLSAFFHQHSSYWGKDSYSFEVAKHKFMNLYDHDIPNRYFDEEIKPLLGIDIFAEPFNKSAGFQIYKRLNSDHLIELLLLRLEDLDKIGGRAFKQFLGVENIKFETHNQNKTKEYKDFLKKIKLPEDFINKIYSGKLATYFYTEQELNSFKYRWTKGITP